MNEVDISGVRDNSLIHQYLEKKKRTKKKRKKRKKKKDKHEEEKEEKAGCA